MKDRGHILVVDDDPDVLATISEMLEFEGYPVERAANGEEGLRAVERSQPWGVVKIVEKQ